MSEVVVVTGASAGVGRAVAREFGRHGALIRTVRGVGYLLRPDVEGAGGP